MPSDILDGLGLDPDDTARLRETINAVFRGAYQHALREVAREDSASPTHSEPWCEPGTKPPPLVADQVEEPPAPAPIGEIVDILSELERRMDAFEAKQRG